MGKIILKDVNKIYPNGVQAVYDFNLEIEDGEFIVLVGPSGCGKTTTLRMIAGLESITSGIVSQNGVILNNMAPKDRDMSMVFQNYALYSHMTVYHNMAFSLTLRKEDADLIHERVMKAAKILELEPYLNRKPKALSGGQRQRVALGRAIVREPKCFLLDEPLSNLDAKLRGSMRKELLKLHDLLKITMIYVTHDQIEAMTLATRIVVMKDGKIQQIGTPKEIYQLPSNMFVAGFIGTPPMNFINGILDDNGYFNFNNQKIRINEKLFLELKEKAYLNKEVVLGIRPEHFIFDPKGFSDRSIELEVDVFELLGSEALIYTKINNRDITIKVNDTTNILGPHSKIRVAVITDNAHFFDIKSEMRINDK